MNVHDVIIGPLVTEKATLMKDEKATVCFRVSIGANKNQIRTAVEKLFSVKVASVRPIQVRGKMKRYGRFEGKRADWKKAFVTLRKGEQMIEFFEGV